MNYLLILALTDSSVRNWQYPFEQTGSEMMAKDFCRHLISTDPLLKNYEGPMQLWAMSENVPGEVGKLICTFDLKHQRSIIEGE